MRHVPAVHPCGRRLGAFVSLLIIVAALAPTGDAHADDFFGADGGINYAHIAYGKLGYAGDDAGRGCPKKGSEDKFFAGLKLVNGTCRKWAKFTKDDLKFYVASDDSTVIVAFRGTHGKANEELNRRGTPGNHAGFEGVLSHKGWAGAVGNIYKDLTDELKRVNAQRKRVIILGRSLGGALAGYFTFRLLRDDKFITGNDDVLVTMGAPRYAGYYCGLGEAFSNEYNDLLNRKGKKMAAYSVEMWHDPVRYTWTSAAAICANRIGMHVNFNPVEAVDAQLAKETDPAKRAQLENTRRLFVSINSNWCSAESQTKINFHDGSRYAIVAQARKDKAPVDEKIWPGDLCTLGHSERCAFGGKCILGTRGSRCTLPTPIPSNAFVAKHATGCGLEPTGKRDHRQALDFAGCSVAIHCPPFHYCPIGNGACVAKKKAGGSCSRNAQCLSGTCKLSFKCK